jgi:hypothetical protein
VELILDLADPIGHDLPPLSPADRAEAERVIGPITGDGNPLDYWGSGKFHTNLPHALATLGASKAYDTIVYCLRYARQPADGAARPAAGIRAGPGRGV